MGDQVWDDRAPGRRPPPSDPPAPINEDPPNRFLPHGVTRVTDERDGTLLNRGYSYWSQSVIRANAIIVFVGHVDGSPRFFQVSREDGTVARLGPLLRYQGTGEGWYWDARGWVYLCDGPLLHRIDPFLSVDQVVLDIRETHPGCRLWQAHSSDDGRTHSATIERITSDGPYQRIGTVVSQPWRQRYYAAQGVLDESQVTADGAYLVIKEDDDNRIIHLTTEEEWQLSDQEGAVGHSDCGSGIVVGEDDQIGACVVWDIAARTKRTLFSTWNMGHVSVRGAQCLLSDQTHLSLVGLDGSGVTPLVPHGMIGDGYNNYETQVHGNLDPTGKVACWLSNQAGRMDVYLMELPT